VADNIRRKLRDPLSLRWGIFCLVSFLIAFAGSLKSQPRIEIPDWKKNFGTVVGGEILSNDYVIFNRGNQPLNILDAEVACSCTTVDFPKKPLLPGENATVTVTFNTTTVYGRQDRIVLLHCNDPGGPGKLRFKANVKRKEKEG
jgi:hypothetical protein